MGGAFYYRFGGVKRVLVVTRPDMLRHILKDNWENYAKSDIQVRHMGQFLGHGLLTDHGARWRRKRLALQEAFTAQSLSRLCDEMHSSLASALTDFDAAIQAGPVEASERATRMTFAMVAESMFSARLSAGEVQQISEGIRSIQAFMVRQIVQPYLKPWFLVSGAIKRHEQIRAEGDAILMRVIGARRHSGARHDDLLQILLDTPMGDGDQRLTDEEVLAESMQMLVAGHETSSTALAWVLYLLASHPEVAEDLRQELEHVLGRNPLKPADLPRLPIMTQVVEEALRLFPPFWMIDRKALAADCAAGVSIRAGETVIAFVHGVHHDERFWFESERFAPRRFETCGKQAISGFHHLPFGAGPRRCIGANYAMLQMGIILSTLMTRYRFELLETPPVRSRPMIIQKARDGVWMRFERCGGVV